jgi:hypothetical protein
VKLKMIAHEHILEKSCSDMQYTGSEGDGFLASQLNERTIQGLSRAPKLTRRSCTNPTVCTSESSPLLLLPYLSEEGGKA